VLPGGKRKINYPRDNTASIFHRPGLVALPQSSARPRLHFLRVPLPRGGVHRHCRVTCDNNNTCCIQTHTSHTTKQLFSSVGCTRLSPHLQQLVARRTPVYPFLIRSLRPRRPYRTSRLPTLKAAYLRNAAGRCASTGAFRPVPDVQPPLKFQAAAPTGILPASSEIGFQVASRYLRGWLVLPGTSCQPSAVRPRSAAFFLRLRSYDAASKPVWGVALPMRHLLPSEPSLIGRHLCPACSRSPCTPGVLCRGAFTVAVSSRGCRPFCLQHQPLRWPCAVHTWHCVQGAYRRPLPGTNGSVARQHDLLRGKLTSSTSARAMTRGPSLYSQHSYHDLGPFMHGGLAICFSLFQANPPRRQNNKQNK
jgi:hypothetical protein